MRQNYQSKGDKGEVKAQLEFAGGETWNLERKQFEQNYHAEMDDLGYFTYVGRLKGTADKN